MRRVSRHHHLTSSQTNLEQSHFCVEVCRGPELIKEVQAAVRHLQVAEAVVRHLQVAEAAVRHLQVAEAAVRHLQVPIFLEAE